MPIEIEKAGDGYLARVTPPHGSPWETVRPLGRDELIAALREQGCHQTDIGDAFYSADPDWLA
jgi:hypothetical protein